MQYSNKWRKIHGCDGEKQWKCTTQKTETQVVPGWKDINNVYNSNPGYGDCSYCCWHQGYKGRDAGGSFCFTGGYSGKC